MSSGLRPSDTASSKVKPLEGSMLKMSREYFHMTPLSSLNL